ncbi:unnamed protein product, partial [Ixodes persulcatus]
AIRDCVFVDQNILASLSAANMSAAKYTRSLLKVVFSTEELKGRSLRGKKSIARKDSPAKEALDSLMLQAGLVNLTKVSVAELAEELVKMNLIDTVLNVIPEDMLTKVTKDEMQYFLDLCDNRDQNVPQGPIKSIFDFIGTTLKSLLIFPGTKWCGAGDVAKNYDDLGRESVTDMCCRDHDHATDSLAPFETEHGVTNVMLYTMTNCQDDCKFYNCLLEVNSLAGNAMGTIFFDTLRTNCFAYGYPDKCVSRNWYVSIYLYI